MCILEETTKVGEVLVQERVVMIFARLLVGLVLVHVLLDFQLVTKMEMN